MQSRSAYGGFEFMPRPSTKYYKELPNKIGDALTPEQYKVCVERGVGAGFGAEQCGVRVLRSTRGGSRVWSSTGWGQGSEQYKVGDIYEHYMVEF